MGRVVAGRCCGRPRTPRNRCFRSFARLRNSGHSGGDIPSRRRDDALARVVAARLSEALKQRILRAGIGCASHIACARLTGVIGSDARHVPYNGGEPAMQDLMEVKSNSSPGSARWAHGTRQGSAISQRPRGFQSTNPLSRTRILLPTSRCVSPSFHPISKLPGKASPRVQEFRPTPVPFRLDQYCRKRKFAFRPF